MSVRALIGAACVVTTVICWLPPGVGAQVEPNLELPLPTCIASASGFIARTQEIKTWVRKAIGEKEDGRLMAKLRTRVSRRGSAPGWTSRLTAWSDSGDYTVHFAVGKVSDYQNPVSALTEAERRAKKAVDAVSGGGRAFVLDWYINEDGVTYALAGAIEPAKAAADAPAAVELPAAPELPAAAEPPAP